MNTILITLTILKNHLKVFKNWFLYEDNGKAVVISGIIVFLIFLFIFNQSQTIVTLVILSSPILITNFYLKLLQKEKNFLLYLYDKKLLIRTKQLQAVLSNLIFFSLLLLIKIVFTPTQFSSITILISEILFLVLISFLQPFFIKEKKYNSGNVKKNSLWNKKISNPKMLPIRSIINREILFIWRANKTLILKYLFNSFLVNSLFLLFILNNNKEEFFVWAVILQFLFLLNFVLHLPTYNNLKLIKSYPCNSFAIINGEFVFWSVLFTIHFIIVLLTYNLFLSEINFGVSIILFLGVLILLAYTLIVRLAYADSIGTRILVFIMLLIPITIPFTIYNSFKKINVRY